MDISNNSSSVNLIQQKYLNGYPGPKDSKLCKHFAIYPDKAEERNQTDRVIQYIACAYEASDFIEMCKDCTSYKIEYCQEDGTTALGAAVKANNIEIVKVILNQKNAPSLINAADAWGRTPLMYAVYDCDRNSGREVLELILDKFEEFVKENKCDIVEGEKCKDIAVLTGLSILDKGCVFSRLPSETILKEILPKFIPKDSSNELNIKTCAFNRRNECYTSLSEFQWKSNQCEILNQYDIPVNDLLLERIENLANTKF